MSRRNSPLCRLSQFTSREGLTLLGPGPRRPTFLAAAVASVSGGTPGGLTNTLTAGATLSGSATSANPIPLWLESAILLGTRFTASPLQACLRRRPTSSRTRDVMKAPNACPAAENMLRAFGKAHPRWWMNTTSGCRRRVLHSPKGNAAFKTTSPSNYQYGYQDDYYDPTSSSLPIGRIPASCRNCWSGPLSPWSVLPGAGCIT